MPKTKKTHFHDLRAAVSCRLYCSSGQNTYYRRQTIDERREGCVGNGSYLLSARSRSPNTKLSSMCSNHHACMPLPVITYTAAATSA